MSDSNELDPKKLLNRALFTLALGVAEKQSTAVASISNEDLILFYQNQLDNERRSQVMHAIANDDCIYRLWIDLVQTNELADELTHKTTNVAQEPKSRFGQPASDASKKIDGSIKIKTSNLLDNLRSWVRKYCNWTSAFGIGCTTALVTVLAIYLVPQMNKNPTLDELYDQYAMIGSELLPERSIYLSPGAENSVFTTTETELAKGIDSGFKELAANHLPQEWEIDPTRYSDIAINLDRGAQSPYALGRLVALSLIQCKMAKNSEFFESAALLIRELIKQNDSLVNQLADSNSNRRAVCDTSVSIIKLL